jgi:hypothetical protein
MPATLKAIFLCYGSHKKSPEKLVNVSGQVYNTRMTNELVSSKYTFACDPDECDCLIEVTSSDGFGFPSGVVEITCPCGRKPNLLSVQHATIQPTNERNTMETDTYGATVTPAVPDTYNPNLLVTYKVIKGYSDAEYQTDKVTSIEWDLHNARQAQKRVGVFEDKINTVKDIITEAYGDSEDQETLRAIAEALDIALTRTIEWSATIEVSGTMQLDLLEDSDTDVESEIYDNLYVDSQNGNIEINDTEVCNVREC